MPVFFVVGTVAVPVLEVDPEILYRFPPELFANAAVDRVREPCRPVFAPRRFGICFDGFGDGSGGIGLAGQAIRSRQTDGLRKRGEVRRVFVKRSQREFAQPPRRARPEQVCSAIDDVNRLAVRRWARIAPVKCLMSLFEPSGDFLERLGGQSSLHAASRNRFRPLATVEVSPFVRAIPGCEKVRDRIHLFTCGAKVSM